MTKIKNVLSWVLVIVALAWAASFAYTLYIDTVRRDASPEVKMKMMANGALEIKDLAFESYGLDGKKWNEDETKVAAKITVALLERIESNVILKQLEGEVDEELAMVVSYGAADLGNNWLKQKQNEQKSGCFLASMSMSYLAETLDMKKWWSIYKKSLDQCKKIYE